MTTATESLQFPDTCGRNINYSYMKPVIEYVALGLNIDPELIETQSQLQQAADYLIRETGPGEAGAAVADRIRELLAEGMSNFGATLNPFAQAAYAEATKAIASGTMPAQAKIEHLKGLIKNSQANELHATGGFQDICGVAIEPSSILSRYAAFLCEELGISPDLIRTKSQLDKAWLHLMQATPDADAKAALEERIEAITREGFEEFVTQNEFTGLNKEALYSLYDNCKEGERLSPGKRAIFTKIMERHAATKTRTAVRT